MAIYPKELLDLVQEYLTDGVISAKERQVLINKAKALGVDPDEFDLYIDAQVQKIDNMTFAAVKKEQGRLCPFCQSPLPVLTDKCPSCGSIITPEVNKEVEAIIDNLEDALEKLKAIGAQKAEDSKLTFEKFLKGYIKLALIIPLFFSSDKKSDEYQKNKAIVERCCRKAKMHYGNNKTINFLIDDAKSEIAQIENSIQAIKRKNKIIISSVVGVYILLLLLSSI